MVSVGLSPLVLTNVAPLIIATFGASWEMLNWLTTEDDGFSPIFALP
jgi:hypothetical protein